MLTSIDEVTGGWQAYAFGEGGDRVMHLSIDRVSAAATLVIDWVYNEGSTNYTFTGSWTGGTLDVVGSGRITIDSFWQLGGQQYAAGTYIWPSGETDTITLVRP